MIIERFGDPYVLAQVLGALKGEDDWEIVRSPVQARVAGMGGAFDFYGSRNFPVEPLTVNKTISVISDLIAGTPEWRLKQAGTGSIYTAADSGFSGVYDDIRPEVRGLSTLFDSEVEAGNQIRCDFGGTEYAALVDSVASDGSLTATDAGDLPYIREYPGDPFVSFDIYESYTPYSRTYAGVETAINALKQATIARGESKLWALMRDGSKRWAWAKCTRFKPPEKYTNKLAVPVSLSFNLPEGLWYAENNSTTTRTANGTFAVTNNGDHPAMLRVALQNLGNPITRVVLSNAANGYSWTFGGTVAFTKSLIVDAGLYSCTNDGVGARADLTLPATQIVWLQLEPGSNALTLTVTQAAPVSWSAVLTWYDTYL